ncbi:MAG: hypothetical protein PHT62_13795 [Desulfotomaculaceae bacterium]|nr:hypothetical protein [Desulfotomaculaceae bacterium]
MHTYRLADIMVKMNCSGETLRKQGDLMKSFPLMRGTAQISRLIVKNYKILRKSIPNSPPTNGNIFRPALFFKAIVFLKQEKENYIRRLNNKEAVQLLIYQSIRPQDCDKVDRLLTLLDLLLPKIPVYQLGCTISMDAVKLVHDTLNQR